MKYNNIKNVVFNKNNIIYYVYSVTIFSPKGYQPLGNRH
jgi:hypothetical protein